MRLPNHLSRGGLGFNMTPMIDVVFLLIIFFLVSSHLARQEVQLDLDLPRAASGLRTPQDEARRIVVNVLPKPQQERRIMVGGRLLEQEWKDGAEAYLGITVAGFPNLFLMYGPNTNLGHNSILFMIECQTRYILQCIERLRRGDADWLDLRPEVLNAWSAKIQSELRDTVWAQTDHSWYKNAAGRITNNWSGTTTRYWWATRKADLADYRLGKRG